MNTLPPLELGSILSPISTQNPEGVFDEEDNVYQGIDSEMIKLGGLQETTIDWAYVDSASRQYLHSQCKHLRIAAHLATARMRAGGWRGWAEAAGVLAGMTIQYWSTSYPRPGTVGLTVKRRLISQQLERLGEALAKLDSTGYAEEYYKAGQQALDKLQSCAGEAHLDGPTLTRLEGQLRQKAEATRAPELADAQHDLSARPSGISEAFFTPIALDQGNERETRRSLLTVADIINQQDAYDPTGYLLRRFALWAHLSVAPSTRKDTLRTELMAVPAETAEAYWDALKANAIDPILLQRVEKSVTSSPYWLRGSFLAAGIARRLEMQKVAEAIRQSTERFVAKLPALAKLQFADGRAFVDGETQSWISGADEDSAKLGAGQEYPTLRDELRDVLETRGVEPMLKHLETIQQASADPRHGCHVMTIAAELLGARGLAWLADGLYARAHQIMQGASAAQWEPSLFGLLEQHVHPATERKN
ncbi:type VI secretion system protein TssA [Salmonella enterica subsp. enterica serovar Eastbourne]|nr:type VI secretion system protein TssA [Salmonella enterica subsp. enterica serovar Eastbourne]EHC5910531.1 type VI secretion system protein TssA [Salmonella enterica subsp. enterica serovar Eastbourne]